VGPLASNRAVIYKRKGDPVHINCLDDARLVEKIATVKEFDSEQMLKAKGFQNLFSFPDPVSSLKTFLSGNADLWVISNITAQTLLTDAGLRMDELEEVIELDKSQMYIAFSKDTPDHIVSKWQKTLDKMKQEGVYGKTYRKWLPNEPVPGETLVVYPRPWSVKDSRGQYYLELLKQVLECTREEYGPYLLKPSKRIIPQSQYIDKLNKGWEALNVIWMPTSILKERYLVPVRIPLRKGLLGWRIFLIRKAAQNQFSRVQSLDDLRKFTIGQGQGWADIEILRYNGFKVTTFPDYEGLFFRLIQEDFDIFSRGIEEAPYEWEQRKDKIPSLHVEDSIVIHYPFPSYYFTAKNDKGLQLARRLQDGLEKMQKNGSFDQHFFKYNGDIMMKCKLSGRKVFHLKNPRLPQETPLDKKDFWYDPMQFEIDGGIEAHTGSQTPLTILTEEFPPVNFTKNGKPVGFAVEIVQEILKRENRSDSIQVAEWAEGYEKALNAPNVAIFSMVRTIQRDPLFQWVGPVVDIHMLFYAQKNSGIRIHALNDAKQINKIAVMAQDSNEQFLKIKGFTNLQSFPTLLAGGKALKDGWVDLWASYNIFFLNISDQSGIKPEDFEPIYTFKTEKLYIAFSKGTSSDIVHRWQRRLDEMKNDGTFDRIEEKCLGKIKSRH